MQGRREQFIRAFSAIVTSPPPFTAAASPYPNTHEAIIVGRPPLKETDVLLHLPSVSVVYLRLDHVAQRYTAVLRTAVNHAARALGLKRAVPVHREETVGETQES